MIMGSPSLSHHHLHFLLCDVIIIRVVIFVVVVVIIIFAEHEKKFCDRTIGNGTTCQGRSRIIIIIIRK